MTNKQNVSTTHSNNKNGLHSKMNNNNPSKATTSSSRLQSTSSDSVFSTPDLYNKSSDNFIMVKDKSKRLLSSSSSSDKKENKKSKQLFISSNRFAPIALDDNTEPNIQNQTPITNSSTEQGKKISLPPPIIVRGIKDFVSVRAELIDIVGNENFSVKATINTLKIQPSNPDAYRAIIHFLKDAEAEFHTYQMKEDKAFRIVLRNLHPTTTPIEIKMALEEIGFYARSVTNVLSKSTKIKLPIFFVDLEPAEINQNIFEINNLLNTKVKIEEPYKRRVIIQCQNCQEYGHSKAYCSYPPRCVRCAAQHHTSTCIKPRDLPAKCALCNGDHPANYRGCEIHKKLQKLRLPNSRIQQLPTIKMQTNQHIQATALPVETHQPLPQQRSYANVTANQESPNTQTNQLDTSIMLTNFINDFKALINPLLSLLTTVLNKLILQNDK